MFAEIHPGFPSSVALSRLSSRATCGSARGDQAFSLSPVNTQKHSRITPETQKPVASVAHGLSNHLISLASMQFSLVKLFQMSSPVEPSSHIPMAISILITYIYLCASFLMLLSLIRHFIWREHRVWRLGHHHIPNILYSYHWGSSNKDKDNYKELPSHSFLSKWPSQTVGVG